MAARTLFRNGSLTGTDPVMTWETVPTETPATSATFLMLGIRRLRLKRLKARSEYIKKHHQVTGSASNSRWTSRPSDEVFFTFRAIPGRLRERWRRDTARFDPKAVSRPAY